MKLCISHRPKRYYQLPKLFQSPRIACIKTVLLLGLFTLSSCKFFQIEYLQIISYSPAEETVDIPAVQSVHMEFSADVDKSKTENAFSLSEDGQVLSGRFLWEGKHTFDFFPETELNNHSRYQIRLQNTTEDYLGNSLEEDFIHTFRGHDDFIRPEVDSIEPSSDQYVDSLRQEISISFSETIDKTSLQEGFGISPTVQGYLEWIDEITVRFVPTEDLEWQTEYTVELDAEISDLFGNTLGEDFSSSFSTGTDTTAPLINLIDNNDGSLILNRDNLDDSVFTVSEYWEKDESIRIHFSEAMDTGNDGSGVAFLPLVAFEEEWNEAGTILTLKPEENYKYNQTYTLMPGNAFSDVYGNQLSGNGIYRFKVNGQGSMPVRLVSIRMINTVDSVIPDDSMIEISSLDAYSFDDDYANPAPNYMETGNGYLDLTFELSLDAELVKLSIMNCFSIECASASVIPLAIQIVAPDFNTANLYSVNERIIPAAPWGDPDRNIHVARIILGIDNSGISYENVSGALTFHLDENLEDSRGNRLQESVSITMLTTN